jgi:hypothetical protein
MDAVFYAIADSLQPVFAIMAKLGNIPNALFIIIGLIAFLAWTRQLMIFRKQGENQ